MKRLRLIFALFIAFLAFGSVVQGGRHPDSEELPNFDKRQPVEEAGLRQRKAPALKHLEETLPKCKAAFDPISGSASFVAVSKGFLSGPNGKGRGISAPAARDFAPNDPQRAAKAFLKEHRDLFGHGPEALDNSRVRSDFTTKHNGLKTTIWQQEVDNIAVFGGTLVAHTTKAGELVTISSHFVGNPVPAAEKGVKNRPAILARPFINVKQAVILAAENLGESGLAEEDFTFEQSETGPEKKQQLKAPGLPGTTHARLVWLPMDETTLRLCWEIILTSQQRGETFLLLVEVETGEVLLRRGLTSYLSDASYRIFTGDSPSPMSPGYPTPSGTQPPEVSRVLIVTNAVNTNASPNGWINDGGNQTVGNNVDAHLDLNADDQPDLPRPQGTSRVFDFSFNSAQPPSAYRDASVVQLFYWCNWMHDKLYELGFTEEAGNFQTDNFNRGGFANDPIHADAHDAGSFNNARFTTYPDGLASRLETFIFTGANPDRDSAFDAEIVLHEYAHGLSTRLVGGGDGMNTLQSMGLGEGWSDFYALALLSQPWDDLGGNYAFGAYVARGLGGSFEDNYYYGLRRYPYSTNLAKNPLTFKDIDRVQASSHPGVPRATGGGSDPWVVHNMGEIWCAALWDARANLIHRYGYAVGNQLILQLVTDGMKLTPRNPNFLQARDAILLADEVNNGGANFRELWAAFAKRGMGFFASSPSSGTTSGLVESFATPDDFYVVPNSGFTSSGQQGGPFLPNAQTYVLTNIGTDTLIWSIEKSSSWLNLSSSNGAFAVGTGTNLSVAIDASIANLMASGIYTNTLTFSNHVSGIAQTREFILRIGQPDFYTELFEMSDFDLQNQTFTFTPDGSVSFYSVCRSNALDFPTDPIGGTAVSFPFHPDFPDDTSAQITVATPISIYGMSTNVFFVGCNGYITLDSGDLAYDPTTTAHFDRFRVSGLFRDLDPLASGALVSLKETSDRVAVTFQNVPNYGLPTTNNFQMELFYDGRIQITYLRVDARNALVGLSAGTNLPNDFVESDFSALPECAPRLEVFLPAAATEGNGALANAGEVRIPFPLSTNLVVNLHSSDATEVSVPAAATLLAGNTNVFFDVIITDDFSFDGTQNATITAIQTNGFLNGGATMSVHDNENAILTLDLPAEAFEGGGMFSATLNVSEAPANDVAVTLVSLDTSELSVPATVIIPADAASVFFSVALVDDALIDGDQVAGLTAHVENWTDAVGSVSVLDDENTNLVVVLPNSGREGNGILPAAGLVRISGALPTNLVISLSSDDPTEATVPVSLIIPAGKTAAAFDITLEDDLEFDGDQMVQITASSPAFISGGMSFSVTDDETPLPPALPSPSHFSGTNGVTVDLSWSPGLGEGLEQIVNGTFESGDFTGWTREASTSGDFIINDGAYNPQSPDEPALPWAGNFSALGEITSNGVFSMYQDVAIPAAEVVSLTWRDRIRNFADNFSSNQEFRVELRDTNNATLVVIYATQANDPLLNDWTERAFNLSSYQGQTIRLAFVVTASFAMDVHLDNVSIRAGTPPLTSYEVYFGTNADLTMDDFLGDTMETNFDLPVLEPFLTYYWKVVAHRTGMATSPTWQFSTVPFISISDASALEGDSGSTTVGLALTLATASEQAVSVDFETISGTASTGDFVATNGTVIFDPGETSKILTLHITSDNAYESNEVFSVILSNPMHAAVDDGEGSVTILNDDPFLAPIPDVTVNEHTPFTFTARAATVSPVISTLITDFEDFPTNSPSGSVLFRDPRTLSGSFLGASNYIIVSSNFPSGHSGGKALRAFWTFNGAANAWVRLTTLNASALPNPIIDFQQVVQFDIYSDRPLRVGLGVRETGTSNAIGGDGGTSGSLEFVGVTNVTSSPVSPNPTRTILASNWQTISFNLPYESITAFSSGNGVLDSSTGKGVLEHLALVPVAGGNSNACNVYLDNFSVVYSNVLTFSLSNAPAGASINPKTGVFTWTPSESQGPGVYPMTVHVSDSSVPPITDSETFTVTVNEMNSAPILSSIGSKVVVEGNTLNFSNTASDSDVPANSLSFSLNPGFPLGASINASSGVFSWTPTEAQGPVSNVPITVRVTDNGNPSLSAIRTFFVTVLESNSSPILPPISDRTVSYGTPILFTNAAVDSDLPANSLTYSLLASPAGATVSTNGVFTWTPNESQTPSTNLITMRVVDNGSPPATNTQSFTVWVIAEPIIQSVTVSNEMVNLVWSSILNRAYRVQYTTNITDGSWNDLPGDVTATGATAAKQSAFDASASRFYRVQLLP